jgi:hypothetical protein
MHDLSASLCHVLYLYMPTLCDQGAHNYNKSKDLDTLFAYDLAGYTSNTSKYDPLDLVLSPVVLPDLPFPLWTWK